MSAADEVFRAVYDFHKANHEVYSLPGCIDEPCRSISTAGIEAIQGALESNWGRTAEEEGA